jgi:hypothetical protein
MKNIVCALLLGLVFTSCKHEYAPKQDLVLFPPPVVKADVEAKMSAPSEKELVASGNADKVKTFDVALQAPSGKATIDTSKKITKEGDIHFETADVAKTRKAIIKAVQKAGGYISEDNQSKDDSFDRKEYVLKVRVPAKNFDFLVDTVSVSADKIDSKNIRIKDVTTEYIDMKSRLDNKQRLEHTYLGLLSQAKRITDVLQIEEKLTETRSDIESSQGELNYLVKQVAYSSLEITFYSKPVSAESGTGFGDKLTAAIVGGWEALQTFVFCLINIWPFVIIVTVLGVMFVKRRKKRLAA